ncbi:MAG: anthranilate synthase component I [Candidatus Binatia bacterium]|nr:MAG: anthranilate synthase component I [Candidatus Binatia bacterium]
MFEPSYAEFCTLAGKGTAVAVTREILADLETPVSAFLKLDDGGDAFLFESVEGAEKWGRYSFLGIRPAGVLSAKEGRVTLQLRGQERRVVESRNPLQEARRVLQEFHVVSAKPLPRFDGGWVGYLGYDLVRHFERLPHPPLDDLLLPDVYLMLVDTFLVFDNLRHTVTAVTYAPTTGISLEASYTQACQRLHDVVERLNRPLRAALELRAVPEERPVQANMSRDRYEAMVRKAKEYIGAGDIIQVVLAQRFEGELRAEPFQVYRCLRKANPAPYMFFLRAGEATLVGSSPEVMVRLEGREVTVRPIAGTRPRGKDEVSDRALEAELRQDAKEIAEHIMLVDLGRNDVGRVAEIGSVQVTECMVVERYSHVMHLVSNVRGTLRAGLDAFDALAATFPAGTLTGAPKIRAMEIIDELEPTRRGVYGGAVGYFGYSGNMDTCITIRTILVKNGRFYVQAGAGIVADSVPEQEYFECVNKARGALQAVRLAESLRPD